jgi:hypothetical protein
LLLMLGEAELPTLPRPKGSYADADDCATGAGDGLEPIMSNNSESALGCGRLTAEDDVGREAASCA